MVTEEAFRRIKVAAAARDIPPGKVIADLAIAHLPSVEVAA